MPKRCLQQRRDAGRPRGAPIVRRVLEETLVELAAAGLAGLSVDRIATRAGLNKTSVYRRWPTKEALVKAALLDGMEAVTATPDTGALETDLLALVAAVSGFMDSVVGRGLTRVQMAGADASALATFASEVMGRGASGPVLAILRRARARGELRRDVPGQLLLFTLAGAIVHRLHFEHRKPTPAWRRSLVRLVLGGAGVRATAGVRR
jgi:AcrR family transcriptional regulator